MRDNAARALFPALVALALVAVVAVAATGSTSSGTTDVRAPSEGLVDTVFSFMLVLLVLGGVLFVYGLTQRKLIAEEMAKGRYRRISFVGFAVFMLALTLLAYVRLRDWKRPEVQDELGERAFPRGIPPPTETRDPQSAYEPEFAWLPIVVLAGVIVLAAVVWAWKERREERRVDDEEAVARAVSAVLSDTLDDLRAEKDPRRAVIAAYARLERVLAAHGLGRRPSETPQEYLHRLLPRLELERGSVRRLTDLFTRAKFSTHRVDAAMKQEAIDALTTVRDELSAAEARRRADALKRLELAEER